MNEYVLATGRKIFQLAHADRKWQRLTRDHVMDSKALASVDRNGHKLFQVVGMARSGTTLVTRMLDSNAQMICFSEPYHSWYMRGFFSKLDGLNIYRKSPTTVLQSLCYSDKEKYIGFKETFRDIEGRGHALPTEKFIRGNFSIGTDFTIAIIRDPRAIWCSLVEKDRTRSDWAKDLKMSELTLSKRFTDTWNVLVQWIMEENVFHLKYETLAIDPTDCFAKITSYMKSENTGYTLEVNKAPKSQVGDRRALSNSKVFSTSVEKFRSVITEEEHEFILQECGKLMKACGYE